LNQNLNTLSYLFPRFFYLKILTLCAINKKHNMKKRTLLLIAILVSFAGNTQNQDIQYPFAEPGTDVTRGVFGKDGRVEVKDAEGYEDFVRATAVMISKQNIYNDEFYSWSLREKLTREFGTTNFSNDVKYLDQPAIGSCSGFLIAPNILVTAGHCINSMEDANQFVWVFDYTSESEFVKNRKLQFEKDNIYEVESIITSEYVENTGDDDYAILRLKRKSDRAPYRFRTSGQVLDGGAINTIGCPTGLPLKFSTDATVVDNSPKKWFKSNIDSFPGNSGGPVFDQNGFIEGILVRGAVKYSSFGYTGDYLYDSNCDCVKTVQWDEVDYTAGCQSHRITEVPANALITAIFENIKYAVENNLNDRFDSWSIYQWIFGRKYNNSVNRLEKLAITSGNTHALSKILSITGESDIDDELARELLEMAYSANNLKIITLLLDNEVLADAGVNASQTLLQKAVKNDRYNIASILISRGANINVRDNYGNSLLHLASKSGNINLCKLLIENGLDAKEKNRKGQRPEKIAKKNKYKSLAKYLKKERKKKRR
jgi:V8-like Glu-specific endopeptidase